MPEEVEMDVREQQEKLEEMHKEHDEHKEHAQEKKEGAWTRGISLSTAMLAVIAAVAALHSGTLVNEALLEENKAVKFQALASDKWAEYQANSLKGHASEQTAAILAAVNASGAAKAEKFTQDAEKYNKKKEGLAEDAKKLEETRNEKEKESGLDMDKHHIFAYCVTFTQVAIALSAIAALTRRKDVWYGSLAVGVVGLSLMLYGFLGH